MFGSEVLEVAIGLVFVYLLLSLFTSIINEIIANIASLRGKKLKETLRFMLMEEGVSFNLDKFYKHALIKKLSIRPHLNKIGKDTLPGYIPKAVFSKAFLESVCDAKVKDISVDLFKQQVDSQFKNSDVEKILTDLVSDVDNEFQLRSNLENFFERAMDIATEWYKNQIRFISFFLGLVISISLNADTFNIASTLNTNPEARKAVVDLAENFYSSDSPLRQYTVDSLDSLKSGISADSLYQLAEDLLDDEIRAANSTLGLGWNYTGSFWEAVCTAFQKFDFSVWVKKFLGFLITGLAVSLGAPFWFDVLSKLINLRDALRAREEKASTETPVG